MEIKLCKFRFHICNKRKCCQDICCECVCVFVCGWELRKAKNEIQCSAIVVAVMFSMSFNAFSYQDEDDDDEEDKKKTTQSYNAISSSSIYITNLNEISILPCVFANDILVVAWCSTAAAGKEIEWNNWRECEWPQFINWNDQKTTFLTFECLYFKRVKICFPNSPPSAAVALQSSSTSRAH